MCFDYVLHYTILQFDLQTRKKTSAASHSDIIKPVLSGHPRGMRQGVCLIEVLFTVNKGTDKYCPD